MVIEYARHVIGLTDATSAEFDDEKTSKNHVVVFMPEIDSTTMVNTYILMYLLPTSPYMYMSNFF